MNLLLDKLPQDYEGLKINTNFRSFILFELLMQDNKVSKEDKILFSLRLFYDEPIEDLKKAIDGILWFYRCGEEIKENKKQSSQHKNLCRKLSNQRQATTHHTRNLLYEIFSE